MALPLRASSRGQRRDDGNSLEATSASSSGLDASVDDLARTMTKISFRASRTLPIVLTEAAMRETHAEAVGDPLLSETVELRPLATWALPRAGRGSRNAESFFAEAFRLRSHGDFKGAIRYAYMNPSLCSLFLCSPLSLTTLLSLSLCSLSAPLSAPLCDLSFSSLCHLSLTSFSTSSSAPTIRALLIIIS